MIVTVGNTKGGVGKTTIAINLTILRAAAGEDVLLVDGDEQGSATLFSQLRAEQVGSCGYTAVELHGAAVRTQVRQLAPKYGDVIIDVGGRDTGSLRAALTVSDLLLIPVQPRSFDIWAIDQMAASGRGGSGDQPGSPGASVPECRRSAGPGQCRRPGGAPRRERHRVP